MNPRPVPTLNGNSVACVSVPGNIYTTEAGMTNYIWTVSPGATFTGGGTSDNTINITWNTSGPQYVRVNYTDTHGCTAAADAQLNVTVNANPIITLNPSPSVVSYCLNALQQLYQ